MAWTIDPTHSQVNFSVRHMMISKIGGRFGGFDGTFSLDEANPVNSVVEGTIDVASVDTGNEHRDAHLRGPDYFDVENHPKMAFSSTYIEAVGEGSYKVTGDMTIKGVTREVVFDVTDGGTCQDPWGNMRQGLSATTKLDRRDFDLSATMPLEGGGIVVGYEISVSIDLELVQS